MSVLLANVACQIQFDKRDLIVKADHPVPFKPETVGFRPETAADAWLGQLAARGVEYLSANGGTDFAPVVEACAKGQALGWRLPEVVIVPHENLGVAMAHGYTMITGRPQAMMVHVGVGTANAVNGLMNASRMNIPILFSAGRTPLTESGAPHGGRSVEAARAIQQLAETFAIPVIHYRPRYLALPTEHPLAAGWDPQALLPQSDLILVVDCDVPWLPAQGNPRPEAKVIHIGPDPLFARYPLRGFRTDLALTGGVAPTLNALCERTQKHASASRVENRRQAVTAQSTATRRQARGGPAAMTPKFASQCVNRLLADDTILVNEYPILLEELTIREPMRYFGNPPSGGLGWGLGAALRATLASPDKTLIATLGDGSYMFGNPTPGHFVAEGMRLPVLYVIFNNARWAAVHRSTLGVYPKGYASKTSRPPFATLEPSPRFEHIIAASGGHGERVTEPSKLMPALERAMKVVRDEKRQALVNVCLEASYVKTS